MPLTNPRVNHNLSVHRSGKEIVMADPAERQAVALERIAVTLVRIQMELVALRIQATSIAAKK